jgi:hypothetical protein
MFGLSTEPYHRALERIEALIERGQDAESGTMRRLYATEDPGKIAGIYLAAKDHRWPRVMRAAAQRYKEATGQDIKTGVRGMSGLGQSGEPSEEELQERDEQVIESLIYSVGYIKDMARQLRDEAREQERHANRILGAVRRQEWHELEGLLEPEVIESLSSISPDIYDELMNRIDLRRE